MSQSILTFQVTDDLKKKLKKRSQVMGVSLSEYLREIAEESVGVSKSYTNSNKWLGLADKVSSVLSQKDIDKIFSEVEKDRKSRSEKSWKGLSNI
jgi:hypothetical protein